ncbi:MAG TPA: 3-phosphoshikimate 1-carboxyvinyltransferase, partial [Rhodanobacteraceae bacterium]|nr:3-phosphoshikimate 1-carboxyvinyltransferase [Rhodanobacteraceae bacterium]
IEGGALHGGEVESHGDHRCAMAFAVAGAVAGAAITIRDCANVATSFPGFVELANGCGLAVHAA